MPVGNAYGIDLGDIMRTGQQLAIQRYQINHLRDEETTSNTLKKYGADAIGKDPAKRQQALSGALQESPDAYAQLQQQVTQLDAQQRVRVRENAELFGSVGQSIRALPYEQRMAALQQMAPQLQERGIDPQQLQSFDPTDQNIDAAVGQAMSLKEMLDKADKDRGFGLETKKVEATAANTAATQEATAAARAEAARHNLATEGQSAATLAAQQARDAEASRHNQVAEGTAATVAANRASGTPSPRQAQTMGVQLRKEMDQHPDTKAFNDVASSYDIISGISTAKATAQNDLSLIFAYMKMLDPGSVVREGEFANAQNTAGIPDQIMNAYNRALNGQRLNDNQRKEFTATAKRIYESRKARYDQLVNQYRGYAKESGLSESTIQERIPAGEAAPATGQQFAEGQIYEDANGNKAKYVNGEFVEVK